VQTEYILRHDSLLCDTMEGRILGTATRESAYKCYVTSQAKIIT